MGIAVPKKAAPPFRATLSQQAVNAAEIVRIPSTPTQLLALCAIYRQLAARAKADGYSWPESLEAWADVLEARRETAE